MKEKVLEAIKRYSLINSGDRVTVALSGGADSMSLLYVLSELKNELGISLYAAHFNHRIRGAESDRDESFVRDICKNLGIRLFVGSGDVLKLAKSSGMSTELAARKLRYDFLESLDTDILATAHTASDNIETVLLNLARGTSLKGLCGIPKKRGKIVRPLILCSREDIEAYCKECKIPFVTDSTNLTDDASRNIIRHKIIPVLREINPASVENVTRMTESLSEYKSFIEDAINREYGDRLCDKALDITELQSLPPAISKGILIRFTEEFTDSDIGAVHIDELLKICIAGEGRINLPANIFADVKSGRLTVKKCGEITEIPEYIVNFKEEKLNFDKNNFKIHKLFLNNTLDCDKIVGELVLRTRQDGDRIRLYRRGCTKTLKSLYREAEIPAELRDSIPILSDSKGVVWIYGIGVAERCAVTECTEKIIKIETEIIKNNRGK